MTKEVDHVIEEATEIVPAHPSAVVPSLSNEHLAQLEQAAKNFDRVMTLAIQRTNAGDWVDQNGKPYLKASGAEKIAVPFGITYGPVSEIKVEERKDATGTYIIFTSHYFAQWGDRRVEYIGRSSTRGDFFSHGGKLSFEEVSLPNVMAQAQTNALGNCITRLLGIRNLTWEQLEKYNVKRSDVKSVAYKKQSDAASSTAKTSKNTDDKNAPCWKDEFKGQQYIFAKTDTFDEQFLINLGMKKSDKKAGLYYSNRDTASIWGELQKMLEFQQEQKGETKDAQL